jgi:hypothetical protein
MGIPLYPEYGGVFSFEMLVTVYWTTRRQYYTVVMTSDITVLSFAPCTVARWDLWHGLNNTGCTSFNFERYFVSEVPGLRWVPCQKHWSLMKNSVVNLRSTYGLTFEFIDKTAAKEKCCTFIATKRSERRHQRIWFSYVRHGYISVRNFIAFVECIQ